MFTIGTIPGKMPIGAVTERRRNRQVWVAFISTAIIALVVLLLQLGDIKSNVSGPAWQMNRRQHSSGAEENVEINDADYTRSSGGIGALQNDTSPVVFVHLGKTAGSTITCQLSPTVWHSGKGDSGCDDGNNARGKTSSAIARRVVKRVHLEPAPVDGAYHNFLVTARNPVDRIVSGFHYIHPDYPPVKKAHHKRWCQNFAVFGCWNTIQSLTEVGLSLPSVTSNHLHSTNQTDEECRAWAWDYAKGVRHCWHNFWNYNRTYGDLLDQYYDQQKTRSKWANNQQQKHIFVIRTEHTVEDWNAIDKLLGGTGTTGAFTESKNNFTESAAHEPNKVLSLEGRTNICRALCDEIQIYKRLLKAAANLDTKMRQASIDELLRSCPNETREARDCSKDAF